MRNTCFLIAGFIALFHTLLSAQEAPIKYGKIPREDLNMTVYPPDTSAKAVVLCDYGKLTFEFTTDKPHLILSRHKRIKILKRAGFDQGDIVIPYNASEGGDLRNLKAQVITPDGTETEVPKKSIFKEKVNENSSRVRFAFPNLCVGCVIEYKYDCKVPYIFELPEWYFQEDIPVRWSELQLEIPSWYQYVSIHQGNPLDVNENIVRERSFSMGPYIAKTDFNFIRQAVKDMPALKEESYITTMDDYYTRMRFQLASIHYPDKPVEHVMSSWEKVAEKLLEDKDFGGQFSDKKKYKKLWEAASSGLAATATREEKIQALYRFVNSGFEREDGYRVYVRENLDDLFEKKSAWSSEMNLALLALLWEAGIEAQPVLISTRGHGQPIPEYPVLSQFNHVLVAVESGDKAPLLLDAGNNFRPQGMVAVNSLNYAGWVVDSINPRWIVIDPMQVNDVYFARFLLDADGNMQGKIQTSTEGYSAVARRNAYSKNTVADFWKSGLQERYPDVAVDSATVEGKDEPGQTMRENFNCTLPAYAQVSGDFIYLTPMFHSSFFENPFKLEKRNYPVDIPYPFKERVVVEIGIPSGYKVESLPETVRLALPGAGGQFHYSVKQQSDKITLNCNLNISQLRFSPEEYDALRSFFGMAVEKFGEQVVLKKYSSN